MPDFVELHLTSLWFLAEGCWQNTLNFNVHQKQHLLYAQGVAWIIVSWFSRSKNHNFPWAHCFLWSSLRYGWLFFLSFHIIEIRVGKMSLLSLSNNFSSHFLLLFRFDPCAMRLPHLLHLIVTIICQPTNFPPSLQWFYLLGHCHCFQYCFCLYFWLLSCSHRWFFLKTLASQCLEWLFH